MLKSALFLGLLATAASCMAFPPALVSSSGTSRDVRSCTNSIHKFTLELVDVVLAVERSNFNPGTKVFKDLLDGVEEIIRECAGKHVDLQKYDICVDHVYPVLPIIGDLIEAIEHNRTQNIVTDATSIVFKLVESVSFCMQL